MKANPKAFVEALSRIHLPSVFNPYSERCPEHDRVDAAQRRRRNLVLCLEAALAARVDTIWIARDLGYRGGRRTGVPLTDEVHLNRAGALFGSSALRRATRGPAVAERTAAIIWSVLAQIGEPAVLWNVFPLHPHESGDPFSNRCHTRVERDVAWPFLKALVSMVRPRRLIAIGRDARIALAGIDDIPVELVRHPSYGGQAEFIAGIQGTYGIRPALSGNPDLQLPLDERQVEDSCAA
jgi:hypothetical protein